MSLATVVLANHAPHTYPAKTSPEVRQIQAALKPYEDRCLLAIDIVYGLSEARFVNYLTSIERRKDLWIYHQTGKISVYISKYLPHVFPALKLLYVSQPMSSQDLAACFEHGIKAVLITNEKDQDAYLHFAGKFYKNLAAGARLEEAYEQARIFVEMENGKSIGKPIAYSDWHQTEKANAQDISWGLFYQKDQADTLSSFLPKHNRSKLASKQEQQSWRIAQYFKHQFLAHWGKGKLYKQLLIVREGPIASNLLCRIIGEEIGLLYQELSIKRITLEIGTALSAAKLALATQLNNSLDKNPFFVQHKPDSNRGVVLQLKLYQSTWRAHGAQLLAWLAQEQLAHWSQLAPEIDIICMLVLVSDISSEEKAGKKGVQIRKITDACKVFATDFTVDMRI